MVDNSLSHLMIVSVHPLYLYNTLPCTHFVYFCTVIDCLLLYIICIHLLTSMPLGVLYTICVHQHVLGCFVLYTTCLHLCMLICVLHNTYLHLQTFRLLCVVHNWLDSTGQWVGSGKCDGRPVVSDHQRPHTRDDLLLQSACT